MLYSNKKVYKTSHTNARLKINRQNLPPTLCPHQTCYTNTFFATMTLYPQQNQSDSYMSIPKLDTLLLSSHLKFASPIQCHNKTCNTDTISTSKLFLHCTVWSVLTAVASILLRPGTYNGVLNDDRFKLWGCKWTFSPHYHHEEFEICAIKPNERAGGIQIEKSTIFFFYLSVDPFHLCTDWSKVCFAQVETGHVLST